MIDDAAKTRLAQFFPEETAEGSMAVLSYRIKKYGIPQALYCDYKNAFVLSREATDAELLSGITQAQKSFWRTLYVRLDRWSENGVLGH